MSIDREVGEIKTQVRYMTQELSEIKSDVKSLLSFKWKILGFAGFAAFLATLIVELARAS